MDKELMNREVLCHVDTRQIQRYMFRSNTMLDTVGASDLMIHILDDAILHALRTVDPPVPDDQFDFSLDPEGELPYFRNPSVQFQLITCQAGNAIFIVRTGALAQKIIRSISRYYLEHGRTLNVSAAAVEKTDYFGNDIFNLYRKLNAAKAASDTLEPLGTLPVCIREHMTGEPVVGYDPIFGDPVSMSSRLRRQEARLRENPVTMQDIHTSPGYDGKNYRAVIHADGNNIGITIGRILQESVDYEDGIRTRRAIGQGLKATMSRIMSRTMKDLEDYYHRVTGKNDGFEKEFLIVHVAGDDINCVCNASWVFPFFRFFYANLKGEYVWKTDTIEVPLYICGGVAFVTEDNAYHPAFSLAEECCSNAKKAAKETCNLRNGLAGNWIDFQMLNNPNSQNLEMLREQSYITTEGISLLMRPYCLDPEADSREISVRKLLNHIRVMKTLKLEPVQNMMLRQSYLLGKENFKAFLAQMKSKGKDLKALLGSPLYKDSEKQSHATWFDAAELLDFIPDDFVDLDSMTVGEDEEKSC
ncbi:MAG: hypothetical protein IJH71_11205 [Eubacterium sp.]|nr:hypothetical protein [Eubacterium sp.]